MDTGITIQYNAEQYIAYITIWCNTIGNYAYWQRIMTQHNRMQHNTEWYNTVQLMQ